MGFRVRSAEGRTLLTRSGHTHSVWLDQTVRGCSLPFHERSGENVIFPLQVAHVASMHFLKISCRIQDTNHSRQYDFRM